MSLTIVIEGKGVIANCDALTNDTGGTGTGDWSEIGGGTMSLTTDTFLYGSSCIAGAYSNKSGWQVFDLGAGNELDFDVAGSEENQHIYMWIHCPTIGLLETIASKGLAIRLGTSTTAYREYIIAGQDDANGWNGGWRCFVVDPTKPGSVSDTGTYDYGSVRHIGVWIDTAALAKGDNIFIDQMAVGKGLRITGTSGSGWAEAVNYCTDYSNRAWGMLQEREGIYYAYGKFWIGDSSGSSAVSFQDAGRVVQFGVSEYYYGGEWVPLADIDYQGIVVEDVAGYPTTYVDGIVVGSDAGRSGSVILGNDNHSVTLVMYGGSNTSSLTKLYGSVFRDIQGTISFGHDADHHMYSVAWERCNQVDPVGGIKIRNCLFTGYYGPEAALLWNENIDIQSCRFIANYSSGSDPSHAIEHPNAGEYPYYDLVFSGNEYDIYFTDTSGSPLTINASGTSNPNSYQTTSGSVIINNTKSYTLENLVLGSEVRAYAGTNPVTAIALGGIETSGSSFTFQHQQAGNAGYIIIHKEQYVPITINLIYPNSDTAIPISQRIDYAYSNPPP